MTMKAFLYLVACISVAYAILVLFQDIPAIGELLTALTGGW